MRDGGLDVQDCAAGAQFAHHFGLVDAGAGVIGVAFEGVYPADVAHGSLDAADVELVLQGNGKAVERTDRLLEFGIVGVEGFGDGERGVEEDFVEAVDLFRWLMISLVIAWMLSAPVDVLKPLCGRTPP